MPQKGGDGLKIEIALSEHTQIFVCSHSEMNSCGSILPQPLLPPLPLAHSLKYSEREKENQSNQFPSTNCLLLFFFYYYFC